MTRTQIQLPDELYKRAKKFAQKRELSLAELTRRGLELFLSRFSEESGPGARWSLPKVHGGGIKVPLDQLHEISEADETRRDSGRK
jgi:hypothetical protein